MIVLNYDFNDLRIYVKIRWQIKKKVVSCILIFASQYIFWVAALNMKGENHNINLPCLVQNTCMYQLFKLVQVACNITYQSVSCFEDFWGTAIRKVPSIDNLNLRKKKNKKKKKKQLWAVKICKNVKKCTRKIKGSVYPIDSIPNFIYKGNSSPPSRQTQEKLFAGI